MRAEDLKAKPGTGGTPMLAGEIGQPCIKKESPIPSMVSKVRRAGFGGKPMT
jgi:hypothetical protein